MSKEKGTLREDLKSAWKFQCKDMFGTDWNIAVDFKQFYKDFCSDIDRVCKDHDK